MSFRSAFWALENTMLVSCVNGRRPGNGHEYWRQQGRAGSMQLIAGLVVRYGYPELAPASAVVSVWAPKVGKESDKSYLDTGIV
jgi:hypothetical protein